ncbi:MAG: hypothetical protein ACW99F_00290 [Candidatus Hodarchaeales archaeon]
MDFDKPRKSKSGQTFDAFKGSFFGVNPNISKSKNAKIRQLSNIDGEITEALSDAGKRILSNLIPFKTDPSASQVGAGNIKSVLQAGGAGAAESLKGAFFEAIISAVVGGARKGGTTSTLDIDLPKSSKNLGLLREIFGVTANFNRGDFKANAGQTLKRTFAGQVIKNASKGYIPNFVSQKTLNKIAKTPAGERAMNTEKSLAGSARMGFDPRVGFGVFNSSQGSLSGAINEHLASGDPRSSLSTMGAASQKIMSASGGYIPNFISGAGIARTPGVKLKKSQKSQEKEAQETIGSLVAQLGGAFALNQIAGIAQQFIGTETFGAASIGTGLSRGTQFAGTGAFIGGRFGGAPGAAIGGVGGFLLGAGPQLAALGDTSKRADFELKKLEDVISETGDSLSNYKNAFDRFSAAKTLSDQVEAQRALTEASKNLSKQQIEAIESGGNLIELQKKQSADLIAARVQAASAGLRRQGVAGFFDRRIQVERLRSLERSTVAGVRLARAEGVDLSQFEGAFVGDVEVRRELLKRVPQLRKAAEGASDTAIGVMYNTIIEQLPKDAKAREQALQQVGQKEAQKAQEIAQKILEKNIQNINERFISAASRSLISSQDAAKFERRRLSQLGQRVSASDLSPRQKILAGGRIQEAQLDVARTQRQREIQFNLQKTLTSIANSILGEGGDVSQVEAVRRALADPSKSQEVILKELLENETIGLDQNGKIIEAIREADFQNRRNQSNTKKEVELLKSENKAKLDDLRRQARAQFAQFTDLSDLGKNLRSVLAPTKGLTTDQLLERTRSAKTVDERLAQLGLSKAASSRAGLQRGIQEGGRLSGLVQVFDQLFPGLRNQNFRFKNAEQFAQQAAGFARRTFTSEGATAEERRSAVFLQRILNDLKSEGIIFAPREEAITKKNLEDQISEGGIADILSKFGEQERNAAQIASTEAIKGFGEFAKDITSKNEDMKNELLTRMAQQVVQTNTRVEQIFRKVEESVGQVTITTQIQGTGEHAERVADKVTEGVKNSLDASIGIGE